MALNYEDVISKWCMVKNTNDSFSSLDFLSTVDLINTAEFIRDNIKFNFYKDGMTIDNRITFAPEIECTDVPFTKLNRIVDEANSIFYGSDMSNIVLENRYDGISYFLIEKESGYDCINPYEINTPILKNDNRSLLALKIIYDNLSKYRDFNSKVGVHFHVGKDVCESISEKIRVISFIKAFERDFYRFGYGTSNSGNNFLLRYAFPISVLSNDKINQLDDLYFFYDKYKNDCYGSLSRKIYYRACGNYNMNLEFNKYPCSPYSFLVRSADGTPTYELRSFMALKHYCDLLTAATFAVSVFSVGKDNEHSHMIDDICERKIFENKKLYDYSPLRGYHFMKNINEYVLNAKCNLLNALMMCDILFDNNFDKTMFLSLYLKKGKNMEGTIYNDFDDCRKSLKKTCKSTIIK